MSTRRSFARPARCFSLVDRSVVTSSHLGRTTRVLALLGLVSASLAMVGCPSRGIPSYDPCITGQRCDGSMDRCIEIVFPGPSGEASGYMCTTQGCAIDADCPIDVRGQPGACLVFDAALNTCFERCSRAGDCATGWSCQAVSPLTGPDVSVCVPSTS